MTFRAVDWIRVQPMKPLPTCTVKDFVTNSKNISNSKDLRLLKQAAGFCTHGKYMISTPFDKWATKTRRILTNHLTVLNLIDGKVIKKIKKSQLKVYVSWQYLLRWKLWFIDSKSHRMNSSYSRTDLRPKRCKTVCVGFPTDTMQNDVGSFLTVHLIYPHMLHRFRIPKRLCLGPVWLLDKWDERYLVSMICRNSKCLSPCLDSGMLEQSKI